MTAGVPERVRRFAGSRPAREARSLASDLRDAFARNDLLTKASAISYQALFALIPAALAGVAMLGFLGLEEYWRADVAPTLRENVSPDAFSVIRRTVERVLSSKEVFWATLGIGLALWEVSGAVRAGTGALNAIFGADDGRPFLARMARSIVIAAAVAVLFGVALAGILAGPELAAGVADGTGRSILAPVLRWLVPAAATLLAIGVMARFAPATPPPVRWVGVTSLATAAAWIVATLIFRLYVTGIASYSSIFGGLASVIVLMTYLYLSAIVFLTGFQLDALLRRRAGRNGGDGSRSGPRPRDPRRGR